MSLFSSLIYNKEDDEVYAGGIGFIEEWKVVGAEVGNIDFWGPSQIISPCS